MKVLYILENLRTPFWDSVMSVLTHLGDEPVFLVLGLFIFWCVDKFSGYFMMMVGFAGVLVNQTLKVIFRVPRPWVIDSNFSVVEGAKVRATGYSFPSGHTQFAVGTFGGLARWFKGRAVRTLSVIACLIVPFSRMYLGVHTPLDVGVSAVLAVVFVFALYPVMHRAEADTRVIPICLAVLTVLFAASLSYMYLWHFPADIDMLNLISGRENLWKLLGAVLGLLLGYLTDIRYVQFETKAHPAAQALKFILGVVLTVMIMEGTKPLFDAVFGELMIRHAVRYLLTVLFAAGVWPMTFKWFGRMFRK